jgi:hypothetical protein
MRSKNTFKEIMFKDGSWKVYTIFASGAVSVTTPISGTGRRSSRWIGNIDKYKAERNAQ